VAAEQSQSEAADKGVCRSTATSRYNSISRLRDEDIPMAPIPPELQNQLAVVKSQVAETQVPDKTFLTDIATGPCAGLAAPLRETKTEVRTTYIQKKREVFLMQMACDDERAEIMRQEEKAKMKEDALARSQQMLDADSKKFEEYLNDKVEKAQKANKDAQAYAKQRQERLQRINQTKNQIELVESEITKLQAVSEECLRYKDFLTKLTPPSWTESQKETKQARKQERRTKWIEQRMAPILQSISEEERQLERSMQDVELEPSRSRRRRSGRRSEEEEQEAKHRERERQARRRRLQKQRELEERNVIASYEEVSSEEELELYFKEPKQIMDCFTELEGKNLFLIQTSQETEKSLEDLQRTMERTKHDMGGNVQLLKESISQLEEDIAHEACRCQELRSNYAKASSNVQDSKLGTLFQMVHKVYGACNLSRDGNPETLQMLAVIESKLEELISGLEEMYHADGALIMQLEKQKEKERRNEHRERIMKEKEEYKDWRKKQAEKRAQEPVYVKRGKKLMARSPPLVKEKREVKDTSEDEANAHDHRVFGVYIDRRTQEPRTDPPPIYEDTARVINR